MTGSASCADGDSYCARYLRSLDAFSDGSMAAPQRARAEAGGGRGTDLFGVKSGCGEELVHDARACCAVALDVDAAVGVIRKRQARVNYGKAAEAAVPRAEDVCSARSYRASMAARKRRVGGSAR